MCNSFDKSLTQFTYLTERLSIVTKEFLNNLDKNDKSYSLIYNIYKSTQAINYEFIKLCYNIRSDKNLNFNLPDIKDLDIPIIKVKNIDEYKTFLKNSNNLLNNSLQFICKAAQNYSAELNREIKKYTLLVDNLN